MNGPPNEEPAGAPPVPLTSPERRAQLAALFDEIEAGQLKLLDESGKRIVELASVLIGVLFGATVLTEYFPPPYLSNPVVRGFALLALLSYLGAMAFGMAVLRPRRYTRYEHNVTMQERELQKIIDHKSWALKWAGFLFWVASMALAAMVVLIIFTDYP